MRNRKKRSGKDEYKSNDKILAMMEITKKAVTLFVYINKKRKKGMIMLKQKLKRIMAVCIALLLLTTLSPAGTGIYAAETEPAIEIDDPAGPATTEEVTPPAEVPLTEEETETTTEAATETITQPSILMDPVPSPENGNSGNNGIMPIDLKTEGVTVAKVPNKDGVSEYLNKKPGNECAGTYFDTNNHYFYVVSGIDDDNQSSTSTVAYCLQANESGPPESGLPYIEGTRGLWAGTSLSSEEREKIKQGLIAIGLYGFGGSAGSKNDGGTYGTYYVDTNNDGIGEYHRGLLIAGVFYELEPDEARAATQAAIHCFCADMQVKSNIGKNVSSWGKTTTGSAANALRDIAQGAHDSKDGAASVNVKGYSKTTLKIYLYDEKNGYSEAPTNYSDILSEDKCVTRNGKKYLQFKVSYSSAYTSTVVSNGHYFNVTPPTENAIVEYGPLNAVQSKNLPNKNDYFTWPNYRDGEVWVFSQDATVYVPYDELQAISGQNVTLSAETNDINYFTPLSAKKNNVERAAMRIYYNSSKQDMGFLSPPDRGIRSASTTFAGIGTGSMSLKKVSSNPAVTNNNPCYSLAGAEYTVTDISGKVVGTLVTDVNGNSNTLTDLPYGIYNIKETKAPKGYKLDPEMSNGKQKTINIDVDNQNPTVQSVEEPDGDPIQVVLQKVDADTGEPVPAGKADLSGAQFTIEYYAGFYEKENLPTTRTVADRTWIIETKLVDGKYQCELSKDYLVNGSDNLYYDTDGDIIIPLGTVTLKETKAPEGYNLDDVKFTLKDGTEITDFILKQYNGDESLITAFGTITIEEPSIRGDFKLRKVDENGEPIANVLFRITSDTTGESHDFVTDKNGEFDSSKSDLWFGGGEKEEGTGALPYDVYTLEEMECEANATRRLIDPVPVSITQNQQMVNIGDIVNDKPVIHTTAKDSETEDHISYPDEQVTIIDTVTYSGLTEGREYTLKGVLHDAATGNELYAADGELITSEVKFTPETTSGTVDVTFTFNGSNLAGKKTVVFEDLYYGNVLYATHADLTDEGQTIYFPEIHTTATDAATGLHVTSPAEKTTIIDRVEYSGLLSGKEYKLSGTLIEKETGEPLIDDGKEVTAEITFVAEQSDGFVDLSFTFNSSALAGETLVAFEDLLYNQKTVAVHADLTDEGQTIRFPEIHTTAKTEKGSKIIDRKEAVIIDTVAYKGLTPGQEVTIKGTIMDRSTGRPLAVNGKAVTAEKTFTPETEDGSIDVNFTFDASSFDDLTLVVFEQVYIDDVLIASHEDLTDEGQTVSLPAVPKTGDTFPVLPTLLIFGCSGAALLILLYRRKKIK